MKLTKIQLLGLVRHILTFIGGIFVTYGTLTSEELMTLVGSASTLAGVIWSIVNKVPYEEVVVISLAEKPLDVKSPKIVAKPKITKSEFPINDDKPKPKKRYYKKKKPVQ